MNNTKQTNNNIEDSLSERQDVTCSEERTELSQSFCSDPITLRLQREYDKTSQEVDDCFKNNVTDDVLLEVLVRGRHNTEKLMNRYCDLLDMDRLYPDVQY